MTKWTPSNAKILPALIVALALLVACTPAGPAAQAPADAGEQAPAPTDPPPPTSDPAEKRLDQDTEAVEPTGVPSTDTAEPAPPTPTEAEPAETGGLPEFQPSNRTGLEATNPASVNLSNGELQFVEFFAFW